MLVSVMSQMLVHVSEKCVRFSQEYARQRTGELLAETWGAICSKGKKKGRLWRKAALGVAKPGFAGGSLLCGGKAGESILVGREVDGLEILDTVLSDVVPNHPVALFLQLIHVDIG